MENQKFELKVLDLGTFEINENEFKALMVSKGDRIFVPRLGISFARTTPWSTRPKLQQTTSEKIEERRKQQVGVLHDGLPVKRHFGQWVLANSSEANDSGVYQPVIIDPKYYPEIAVDLVADYSEWEKVRELNPSIRKDAYYQLMIGQNYKEKLTGLENRTDRGLTQLFDGGGNRGVAREVEPLQLPGDINEDDINEDDNYQD